MHIDGRSMATFWSLRH